MSERRRDSRYDRRLRFHFQNGDADRIAAETINISSRGLYCVVPKPVPAMTKLRVALDLPLGGETKRMECEGVVVRSEKTDDGACRVAIYFLNLDREAAAALERYLLSG